MSLSSELPATSRKVHPLSRITRWRKAVPESLREPSLREPPGGALQLFPQLAPDSAEAEPP